MILQAMKLSGWRCFLEEISIGPFSDRLNVISGPNGIGKSTLFEALRRALMDSHIVTGQDISAVRPWGRDLSPRITVLFSHGGVEYRITKQFLEGGSAKLERREDGAFRPLAEGRKADEQVRELLSKNPPGKGLSHPKHWGLAQVLWAPQGSLFCSELSGDLVSDIRSSLGAQVADRASGPIEQKIIENFERFFTSQGKIKSGKAAPPVVQLQAALVDVRQRRTEALDALQRCEESSRRVEELKARHGQMNLEADELVKTVQNARQQSDQYRTLTAEQKNRNSESEKIEAQYKQLKQHIDLIRSTEKDIEEAKIGLARLESDASLRRRDVVMREKVADEATTILDDVRRSADIVDRAEKDADDARLYSDSRKRHLDLGTRVGKIEGIQQNLSLCRDARTALVAPDAKTLKAIRKTLQQRDEAKLLVDAAMINLEILPEVDGRLEIIRGEEPGLVSLSYGVTKVLKGSPEILADLKGVARLRASGPAGDVETHRQTVRKKEQSLAEMTRPFGTTDMESLEELAEKASRLEREIAEYDKELAALLGEDDIDTLKGEIVTLEATMVGIEKDHSSWKTSPPDSEALKRTAADIKGEFIRKVRAAEAAWDATQMAHSTARGQEQSLLGQLEDARTTRKILEAQQVELTRDGKSLSDREKEIDRLLLEWNATKKAIKDIQEKIERFEDDPEAILIKLEKSLEAFRESIQKTRDEERKAMGILETLAARGPYSILAQAEEDITRLGDEIRKEMLRLEAIRLLHNTVDQCRNEAVADVARPVEEAATRLLHRIAGRRIGRVQIGEAFGPTGVAPEMVGSPVGIDNLSGGEQEQLYLATRLALADVLAKDERQMVVFDDVLTATDTGRLARVLTLLEEAADRLQILILTCHPERYRALSGAQFFELEALFSANKLQ